MNSTKRKFATLLNSLGSKSTTSLDSLPTANASTTSLHNLDDSQNPKRRRITSAHFHAGSLSSRARSVAASDADMVRNKSNSLTRQEAGQQQLPKYAPWDRAAFLKRLESFAQLLNWAPKPDKVNEVEWAKRGWVCSAKERVRCCLCNIEVAIKLAKKEEEGAVKDFYGNDMDQALVDKYAELIVTSHSEECLWRKRGCDGSILHLPLNHPASTLRTIRERYDGICTIDISLPYMHNLQLPSTLSLDTILAYLPKDFFTNPPPAPRNTRAAYDYTTSPPRVIQKPAPLRPLSSDTDSSPPPSNEVNRVALALALTGWALKPLPPLHDRGGTIHCTSCFRNLGLWLYKSKSINPTTGEMVTPPPLEFLDPVIEHRDYCPWRNADVQSGSGMSNSTVREGELLAAWQVVVRVIKNDYLLREVGNVRRNSPRNKEVVNKEARAGGGFRSSPSAPDTLAIRGMTDDEAREHERRALFEQRMRENERASMEPDEEEERKRREEKDKKIWERLKKVRGMFEKKGGKGLVMKDGKWVPKT